MTEQGRLLEISREEMIACVRRELALRRGVYPKWVAQGRMTQAKADHEIACMEAVLTAIEGAA